MPKPRGKRHPDTVRRRRQPPERRGPPRGPSGLSPRRGDEADGEVSV
ncbi:hypothetical protein N9L68_04805 [bacterium]|nr:hypothetical protein [bacterium]